MTQFVSQDCNHFTDFTLLNQSIVDNDVLAPRKSEKVRVTVCGSLRSINHVQMLQWELQSCRESLNIRLQLSGLHRCQSIEQGQNPDGVHGNHESLDPQDEEPDIVKEVVTKGLDDGKESSEDGTSEDNEEDLGLNNIGEELEI